MNDNIFFDLKRLKKIGKNVIIGKTVRVRYPELVEIGDNVIIDDFSYISTALKLNDYCHISSGAKIIGGRDSFVQFDSFSTLAPQVVLSAGSDDYESGIATPMVGVKYKANVMIGKILIGKHCIIGAGSVVLPNVTIKDGVSIGALSLVKSDLEAWKLYAGIPVRFLKNRNKEEILKFEEQFLKEAQNA
jgi:galactoside O-acetyltransferase